MVNVAAVPGLIIPGYLVPGFAYDNDQVSAFTVNYVPNPAFQNGLSGYSAANGATLSLDTSNIIYGPASALVTCPGLVSGEGITTAPAVIPTASTGSGSLFLNGTGDVVVSVVVNGVVSAIQHVTLSLSWSRPVITGVNFPAGSAVYLSVETTSPNAAQFWLSGVQVEETSPAHPYIDGDQDGSQWLSGSYGISEQIHENPLVSVSSEVTASFTVVVLNEGEAFLATPLVSSEESYGALISVGATGPVSSVTDFAVSPLSTPDPAQTYVSWNNAGLTMSTSAYNQSWATFIPPVDYLVSNGQTLYKRAAYAALGWKFPAAAANNNETLARVQAQLLPVLTGYGVPAAPVFDNPRALHSIIVANRINFVTNPSFEVSVANWTATGTATLSQSSVTVGDIGEFDDREITTGTHSMEVTINSNSDGAEINVSNLIPGYTYIASAYVKADVGLENILLSIANGNTSVQASGGTGYNYGAYNVGPYGGFDPTVDLSTTTWWRIWCVFEASSDTELLEISSSSAVDVSYPTHMWIDGVLVEQGELLNTYFDGSSYGPNYSWDSVSGSPGLARSYYYDEMAVKQQAVVNVLNRHTPLGISYDTPVYSVPPIQ